MQTLNLKNVIVHSVLYEHLRSSEHFKQLSDLLLFLYYICFLVKLFTF